jgi:phosphoribosylformylglycinamidine cyclo-ligase
VGVVEEHRIIDGTKIEPGDAVLGLPSSGLHSNGYSLARRLIFEEAGLSANDSLRSFGIERTVADELLTPTRIYVKALRQVLHHYRVKQVVRGVAHITGGGLVENVPRVLPRGCRAEIEAATWDAPPIFAALQQIGNVPPQEMFRTFNMGIGMVLIVSPYYVDSVVQQLRDAGEDARVIGRIVEGPRDVVMA